MATILRELGFLSSKADPDVWMRKGRKDFSIESMYCAM
jgi:hypothetical protein